MQRRRDEIGTATPGRIDQDVYCSRCTFFQRSWKALLGSTRGRRLFSILLRCTVVTQIGSRSGLEQSPFPTLQEVSTLRKQALHFSAVINLPSATAIVAIIPYFGRSLGDTGDIAALQAVDKVAEPALPTEDREEPAFPAIVGA